MATITGAVMGTVTGTDSRACTGKVTGLMFDHFGDFDGFLLDTGERDDRFFSREPSVRELAEVAWREHLRVTVVAEDGDRAARIRLHRPARAARLGPASGLSAFTGGAGRALRFQTR